MSRLSTRDLVSVRRFSMNPMRSSSTSSSKSMLGAVSDTVRGRGFLRGTRFLRRLRGSFADRSSCAGGASCRVCGGATGAVTGGVSVTSTVPGNA